MSTNQIHRLACRIHFVSIVAQALLAGQTIYAQQSILGKNLIVNGDAESGSAGTSVTNLVSSIPGWTRGTSNVNVVSYDIKGLIASTDPAPPDHNFQFFVADPAKAGDVATATQIIDVSSIASTISGGNVKFSLSGYLGSANGSGRVPTASLAAVFQNAKGQTLSTVMIGPLGYNGDGMFLQQQIGLTPAATTQVLITLSLGTAGSTISFGSADSLSLVLTTLGTSPGSVLGTNLVVNGNAEAGPAIPLPDVTQYIPGWSRQDGASVEPYGATRSTIGATDPGPVDRGVNLFCGGLPGSASYQDIDVSAAASLIDASQVTYQLSAWLGASSGFPSPTLTYTFYDWTGKQLASTGQLMTKAIAGGGLTETSNADTLPAGTRRVRLAFSFQYAGSAMDDISFILSAPSGPPVIDPGGIVNLTAFGGGLNVAQGSWIEIYGRNLASTTASWSGSDFNNGVGPTTLQGVSVSIGGQPAFVNYVSPGQIDTLLPSNAMTGPAPITVTNANGSSDPFYVAVSATQPSLLAPTAFTIGGKQYVAAFNPDGTFALPQNAIVGVSSTPATVGQTVVLYGIGFGPVSDGVTAGTLPTQQDSLTLPLVVSVAGVTAQLAYGGLATGLTGLYQINVVIPKVATNNAHPVTLTLGTTKGSQTLYIAVN